MYGKLPSKHTGTPKELGREEDRDVTVTWVCFHLLVPIYYSFIHPGNWELSEPLGRSYSDNSHAIGLCGAPQNCSEWNSTSLCLSKFLVDCPYWNGSMLLLVLAFLFSCPRFTGFLAQLWAALSYLGTLSGLSVPGLIPNPSFLCFNKWWFFISLNRFSTLGNWWLMKQLISSFSVN